MKISSRPWWLAVPLLAATLGANSADSPRDEPLELGDDYRSGDYGRVRDAESGLTIVRAEWDQERDVSDLGGVNSPIFPGDAVSTATGQRVEVQLASGTLVWIDHRTEVEFLALPDPYADFPDHAVLKLREGQIRLATSLADEEEFRVDTPAASVYPLGNADVRIEVGGDGWTRILSRRGVVEVVGQGGSVLLRGGEQTEVEPGALPLDSKPFHTFADDAFDRWVEDRTEAYAYGDRLAEAPGVYRDLPDEIRPYYRELSANGTWSHVDDYGYVWQPVGIATDWKPYYDGYWGYGPHGYFWISDEPWGWAPYHYGRWSWIDSRGWCWSPGRVFGGAWVSWSWGSVYVGWSPLNHWNSPAHHSTWHYGYYDPFCWTFVGYRHFGHRHYSRYSVGWDHVHHDVHRSAVVTRRAPRYAPAQLASSADARRRAHAEVRSATQHRLAPSDRREPRPSSFRSIERRSTSAARTRTERRLGDSRRTERGEQKPVPVVTQPRYQRRITADKPLSAARSRTPRTRTGYQRPPVGAREEKPRSNERLHDIYRKMARPRQTREQPTASRPSPKAGQRLGSRAPRARSKPVKRPTARTTPGSRTPTARSKPAKRPTTRTAPGTRTPTSRPKPVRRPTHKPQSRTPTARPKPRPKTATSGSRSPTTRPSPRKKNGRR